MFYHPYLIHILNYCNQHSVGGIVLNYFDNPITPHATIDTSIFYLVPSYSSYFCPEFIAL